METSRRLSVLPARWEYIILHLKHMLNVIFQEMLEKEAVLMLSFFPFYILFIQKNSEYCKFAQYLRTSGQILQKTSPALLDTCSDKEFRMIVIRQQLFLDSFICKQFSFFLSPNVCHLLTPFTVVLLLISAAHGIT